MNVARLTFTVLAFLSTAPSFAGDLDLEILSTSLSANGKEITVTFADKEPVPNACDLFVKRMEYVPELQSLMLEARASSPCFYDRYARRKGKWTWTLPEGGRAHSKLRLILNDRVMGTLNVEHGDVTFVSLGV